MKKIAMVIQRYGKDAPGGAQMSAYEYATRLKLKYEVSIITTTAKDSATWKSEYLPGISYEDGIKIIRFDPAHERNMDDFRAINMEMKKLVKVGETISREMEEKWINTQGPYCPDMIEYIKTSCDLYDVFVFITYIYYHSICGLPEVSEKAIFIPTAHNEPSIYFDVFYRLFNLPKEFLFMSHEEDKLVRRITNNSHIPGTVIGHGIIIPRGELPYPDDAPSCYVLYAGRIDISKGCKELFEHFITYKQLNKNALKLVLIGSKALDIPDHKDILYLGFVNEEKKFQLMHNAKAMILPSKHESLSISVLESLAVETPVIVNKKCAVLEMHCIESNAGLYYDNYWEFEGCVNYILTHQLDVAQMGKNGIKYVEERYDWDNIMKKWDTVLERVC